MKETALPRSNRKLDDLGWHMDTLIRSWSAGSIPRSEDRVGPTRLTADHDDEEGHDRVDEEPRPKRRPDLDTDDVMDFEQWRKERGQRGRKRRDKAGGRHRKNRDRWTDD
jgi:hypothetical protein